MGMVIIHAIIPVNKIGLRQMWYCRAASQAQAPQSDIHHTQEVTGTNPCQTFADNRGVYGFLIPIINPWVVPEQQDMEISGGGLGLFFI